MAFLSSVKGFSENANYAFVQIRFRQGLPPGDGVLFYPGEVFSSSSQPVASLRLERILSGLQVGQISESACVFHIVLASVSTILAAISGI